MMRLLVLCTALALTAACGTGGTGRWEETEKAEPSRSASTPAPSAAAPVPKSAAPVPSVVPSTPAPLPLATAPVVQP